MTLSSILDLGGLGRKNDGPVNDLNFPGSADRFAGLLHPLHSPKCSKTIILRVQQAVACFTRSVKKVSKKVSRTPESNPGPLKLATHKIPSRVGVYTSNLVTDRQTDLVSPTPLIGRQKLLKHFSETRLLYMYLNLLM